MFPFYFGPLSRRLFGAFHEGSPGRSRSLGVLLCNPLGQEAIRTHRLYRVLAIRLAQAGIHVLRFDYHGTGDSAGDDGDASLESWRDDVAMAHRELQRLCSAQAITWVGARLGASAVIGATRLLSSEQPGIVVWDPIVNGESYARVLRAKHVEALEISYSLPDPAWRSQLEQQDGSFRDEAIGVAISPAMRQHLAALSQDTLDLPIASDVFVISDPEDRPVQAWIAAQRARGVTVQALNLPGALEWTSDDSLNVALVPVAAVQQLLHAIDR